ncbi:MAG: LysE family transporter [Candidatus Marinimicrobia bacterium]|nr:LysE family transporter [Candidatus Neomarinimicrobiota bacterium]
MGQHVLHVALFCAVSDTLLISLGVTGISFFLNNLVSEISNILFGFSAVWLSGYGILRLKAAFKSDTTLEIETSSSKGLLSTLSIVAVLTFANPHVYLDTMILIGSVSQQFPGENKLVYALGASLASFVFFFSLAYGAKLLAPKMQNSFSWRILDFLIALIMFTIAIKLAYAGNWL